MAQCDECRYAVLRKGEMLCKKREVQLCRNSGDRVVLSMVPGRCRFVNPDNDCELFEEKFWLRLKRSLRRP